ncbi:MAG TPA: gluconate 2-dehydrogenase subunit 3 family protein [Bryobacteraceae bacterium]
MTETDNKTSNWIRDGKTRAPMPPMEQPGYYPGYRIMSQKAYWDAATRRLVEDRLYHVPPIRFFTPDEVPTIEAIVNRILPQDDRIPEKKIPVLHYIDERLFEDIIDGYRFADMPPDREAYRLGIQAIDETARKLGGKPFAALDPIKQDEVLQTIHDGKEIAARRIWKQMSIHRFWHTLVQDCVAAYYSHPWAWDEIGYGGPAYPRAYTRLEGGQPEPWEVDEQPYEWLAPVDSLSDTYEPLGTGPVSVTGQGGTH